MRPKRYPFSGAKKESEAKKISLMLKKARKNLDWLIEEMQDE